ncbi:MAG TPA: MFS transporter [Bacteroidales bacterium]|nr:MFS transporter [Bacteroidales bacterium]HPT12260.1 MFS transporter [Bacteroidales bacterium]
MTDKEFKRSVLTVTAFASFLTPFMGSSVNLALPAIGNEFGANAITLSWITLSYMLSTAIFLLPAGRAGDILGRKKVFTAGIFLFTLAMLLLTFTPGIKYMLIVRVIQGVASAMVFGTNMAILTSVFPAGERGRAMGINVTFVYLGLASGPSLGGVLTRYLGWRSIFAFLVPMGILSLILIKAKIREEWRDSRGENFDWPGALTCGASLAAIMYGFSILPGIAGWILTALGIILIALFFYIENRSDSPIFDVSLLHKNKVFAYSSLAALIHYAATSAIGFFLSLYLKYIKGMEEQFSGLILMSWPVLMALLSPIAGKLSDKHNPGRLASTGMALTASGLLFLCTVTEETAIMNIILMLALLGIGFGLFSSPNTNAIMSSVEKRQLGNASGMTGTVRMVGQTLSMGIATMLLAIYMGKAKVTPENHIQFLNAMKTGFVVFSVLCIIGIFASLQRNKDLQR